MLLVECPCSWGIKMTLLYDVIYMSTCMYMHVHMYMHVRISSLGRCKEIVETVKRFSGYRGGNQQTHQQ